MEKFYENSDFAIYTDKKNEIVDLYNKVTDTKTRFMADTLDEAISAYHKVNDYPWAEISYKGRKLQVTN